MAKRRPGNQQRRHIDRRFDRIAAIKARRSAKREAAQATDLASASPTLTPSPAPLLGPEQEGRIVTHFGQHLVVVDGHGNTTRCLARQNLDKLVCGDRVTWQADLRATEASGIIITRGKRDNLLKRKDGFGILKPVAANISRLCIVNAPLPLYSAALIDRYIVAAEDLGIQPLLLINKSDTLGRDERHNMEQAFETWRRLGYTCRFVSARRPESLEPLLDELKGHTSILVGQSGTGKSSLANALIPDLNLRTQNISESSGLGTHTTTATTLYDLPRGGKLIDSPGVRSFGLLPMPREQVAAGFREFRPMLGHCRFHNCSHRHEPGCAIIEAVNHGKIGERRYQSFLSIAAESETS